MAFDPKNWTLKTTDAVNIALGSASDASNPEVTPDHLLAALLRQEDGVVLGVLNKIGVSPLTLRNRADEAVERLPKAYGGETRVSKELTQLFEAAGLRFAFGAEAIAPLMEQLGAELSL